MKLAEFFVTLGIDIGGAPELKKLEKDLNGLTADAAKLLAIFGGLTAAMTVMLNRALDSANAFRQFNAVTGLSTQELKKWEFMMVQAGGEAGDLVSTVKALQQARTDIMMGTGNVAPWQLLGIAPSKNPFDTLKALKERIKDLDPAVARNILGQMGVGEGVFAMLRLSNEEFAKLEDNYQITIKQQAQLNRTSRQWAEFKYLLSSVKDQLVAELVPALTPLLRGMIKVVGVFSNFVQWLSKGSPAAQRVKVWILSVIAGIVAMTAALTVLVGVLGLAATAVSILTAVSWPILLVLGKVALIVGVVVAALVAMILVYQDLWVAIQGGDSVLGELIKKFTAIRVVVEATLGPLITFMKLLHALEKFEEKGGKFKDLLPNIKELAAKVLGPKGTLGMSLFYDDPSKRLEDRALAPSSTTNTSNSSVRQENNIDITVQGGGDPYQVGRAVADPLKEALSNAAYQIPVPAI